MLIVHENDVALVTSPNGNRTNGLVTRAGGATEVSVVRQEQEPGGFNPPHMHDREEVMLIRQGVVTVTVGEESVQLAPGDLLVVPAHTLHQVRNAGDTTGEWLYLSPTGMRFLKPNGEEVVPSWET